MVKTRLKDDNINNIFYGKGEKEEIRYSKKQFKNKGNLSFEENKNKKDIPDNNNKSKNNRMDILKKYNKSHFNSQNNDNDYINEKPHIKVFQLNNNMKDILSSNNIPKDYDIYSTKPNEVNYKTLVSSLPNNYENLKKFGRKSYY